MDDATRLSERRGQRPAGCRLVAYKWKRNERMNGDARTRDAKGAEQRGRRMWSWQNAGRAREKEGGRPHDGVANRRREHHQVAGFGKKQISRSPKPVTERRLSSSASASSQANAKVASCNRPISLAQPVTVSWGQSLHCDPLRCASLYMRRFLVIFSNFVCMM